MIYTGARGRGQKKIGKCFIGFVFPVLSFGLPDPAVHLAGSLSAIYKITAKSSSANTDEGRLLFRNNSEDIFNESGVGKPAPKLLPARCIRCMSSMTPLIERFRMTQARLGRRPAMYAAPSPSRDQ